MFPQLSVLLSCFDPVTGQIPGAATVQRHLSDLRGCFADEAAYDDALIRDDPLVYSVASIEPANDEGALHYGVGRLMPGLIGDEYYLTKGHLHAWRPAAEIYLGLAGQGMLLLEEEGTGLSVMVPLGPNHVVYVPGGTAHRTVNTGSIPLTYVGIYPARAGHDYKTIMEKNFRHVIVNRNGMPTLVERAACC